MSRLLEARERAGWSRAELAKRAGIGREWLRLLEIEGGREPGVRVAQRIARALGTTAEALWPVDHPVVKSADGK